ncbi:hypothetical protein LIER_15637 [Lithospermum erythrorhizon]|uniref:RRM domain-containing protein n=1 Tax=Lithospermum erythrorhizon TaxID=34254 RepID=A0AAV3Q3L8_LITER
MERGNGKLFVGGISWDTNEDRLRGYFQSFGVVSDAVIIKDRITGRARGFGFVVFADPLVADGVAKEKHIIDGRTVDVKRAVPRDVPDIIIRNNGSTYSSPGPTRTKKVFVGGLPSDITESDFKKYFDQFGTITDVVVMYDHNTKRPRGFGFITYDSEEAVENVLLKKFHELNGKMVEVKQAVPKELSPGTTASAMRGYTDGLYRVSNLLNEYPLGHSLNSVGGYGIRLDGKFSPFSVGQTQYHRLSPSGYGQRPNLDSGLTSNYGIGGAFASSTGEQGLNTYYDEDSNRFSSPIRYDFANIGSNKHFGTNPAISNNVIGSSRNVSAYETLGSARGIWGSSTVSSQGGRYQYFSSDNIHYLGEESSFSSGLGYGRNNISSTEAFDELYGSASFNGDASSPFAYAFGNSTPQVTSENNSVGYSLNNKPNRGTNYRPL